MTWQAQVVELLCASKRTGYTFEEAWREALALHPPRGRDAGPARPSLLDEGDSVVTFFERACADAWHGRLPALKHFHPSLLMADEDDELERWRLSV